MERHQTLLQTVQWSYDLLSDEERTLFTRLGVFAGGVTLRSVEAVCAADPLDPADVIDLVDGLSQRVTEDNVVEVKKFLRQ